MMTTPIRTASLALAAGGLALAGPASALPASRAYAPGSSPSVHGVTTAAYGDDDRGERGGPRGWNDRDRDDRRYESRSRYRAQGYPRSYYDSYRAPAYQPRGYYNSYPANYGEPAYNNTRVWRGDDNRYYCRRSNGTTGLLIGGAAGALLGREVVGRYGDRTLGAVLGAAGGALLGKSIDSRTRCG